MTEDQLEQEALAWLAEVGYTVRYGLDVEAGGSNPLTPTRQKTKKPK